MQFVTVSVALLVMNIYNNGKDLCNQQPEHYHQCHKQEEAGKKLFIHILRSPWNSWKTGSKKNKQQFSSFLFSRIVYILNIVYSYIEKYAKDLLGEKVATSYPQPGCMYGQIRRKTSILKQDSLVQSHPQQIFRGH